MLITTAGLELIKKFERFSSKAYVCPAGHLTIGYGHLIAKHERLNFQNGIDESTASELLEQDVRIAERAVLLLTKVPLTDNQFSAIVSFTFNVGSGGLQRSTLLQVINRQEHEYVPSELQKWVYAGGKRLQGLVIRRMCEANLYMQGVI